MVPVLRLLILGAIPYLLYCGFRGVIDAVSFRPINALNTWYALAAGAGVFVFAARHLSAIHAIAIAVNAALAVLAVLTVRHVARIASGRQRLEEA